MDGSINNWDYNDNIKNAILMVTLLLFEIFIIESLVEGNVNKLDNKLLKQQIDFLQK